MKSKKSSILYLYFGHQSSSALLLGSPSPHLSWKCIAKAHGKNKPWIMWLKFIHKRIRIFLFCKCSSLISLTRFLASQSIQTYPLLSENEDPFMKWKEPVILIPILTNKSGFVPEFHLSTKHHWNYCIGHKSCSIHTYLIYMQSVYIYIHAFKYIGTYLFSHIQI